ncbi:unnamed protein product [Mytilus edulis]|uniref:Uncharacterized protein n=1 Tax=Mytilus edulis TaxID=6550 RepID=A0A8S3S4J9_MYTED|nr:unnamed protein product [Mytilus edulis]
MRQNRYRIIRDFILQMLLIFNELSTGTRIRGQNVCWKVVDDRRIAYCCFNHYLLDGHCHECKSGTTSTDGIVCLPCSENRYGHKCKYHCECESYQRCDPEFGCVELSETSSQLEISSQTESDNDSRTPLLYIVFVSAGLITWLIICWTCSKICYKRIIPEGSRTSQIKLNPEPLQQEPIQLEQVNKNCKQTDNIDGTNLVQNRSVLRRNRLPVKSQHIYDSVCDSNLHIDQQHIGHADREEASAQSSDEVHCAPNGSNLIKRELFLNLYQKLNEKRDTKAHDYIGIDTTTKD